MRTRTINPATLYDGAPSGMSQAKVDEDSGLVFVSGQVNWDTDHQARNRSIEAQAETAIKNLRTVLEEAHSSFDHLLQLRVYVRGEVADHLEKIAPILAKHFGGSRPALTGVGVSSLASPDLLIEIEAVAKVAR